MSSTVKGASGGVCFTPGCDGKAWGISNVDTAKKVWPDYEYLNRYRCEDCCYAVDKAARRYLEALVAMSKAELMEAK